MFEFSNKKEESTVNFFNLVAELIKYELSWQYDLRQKNKKINNFKFENLVSFTSIFECFNDILEIKFNPSNKSIYEGKSVDVTLKSKLTNADDITFNLEHMKENLPYSTRLDLAVKIVCFELSKEIEKISDLNVNLKELIINTSFSKLYWLQNQVDLTIKKQKIDTVFVRSVSMNGKSTYRPGIFKDNIMQEEEKTCYILNFSSKMHQWGYQFELPEKIYQLNPTNGINFNKQN